ncbi:Rts3p KNAG_0J02700 [Huiozyma naganishii CBS 8797]|uniref:Uncharacterized protein n=1 Tax=Huiozyma naganishii (strain ATCC MYA-139 / BCRC 22969 / CBS 8797 / KCTC 17520 / NBRC 10181 / NCYC 3082 / Yp74L-3) TaxID=1071383 RepID=J7S9X3_HUIN7|nr:hypothetical protein KNAG_0J02700 [Kazachstania naganishii CBS 8797]CCK72349.1 hypothetical protein KNAG_0J02700 [Kazachstania naganishii CBS 8797]
MQFQETLGHSQQGHLHVQHGHQQRRLSREEIINKMENEQDAIVVKLLREIEQLKQENNKLRTTVNILHKRQARCEAGDSNESAIVLEDECVGAGTAYGVPTPRNSYVLSSYAPTPSHSRQSSFTQGSVGSGSNVFPLEVRAELPVNVQGSSSGKRRGSSNYR